MQYIVAYFPPFKGKGSLNIATLSYFTIYKQLQCLFRDT